MSTLEKAIEIATLAHKGQVDKAGEDYIKHPLRVMEAGKTENEKIVGVLHDVVEDTEWTFEKLEQEGFSEEVISALRCVTKLSEDEPYDDFIARVKTNSLATAVKINDLTDNMDIRRLPSINSADIKRLKKYHRAYRLLSGLMKYTFTEVREKHANAYMPWTEEDDERLTLLWCEGRKVHEMIEIFQRKKGAITSRIKKLELKEKYGDR